MTGKQRFSAFIVFAVTIFAGFIISCNLNLENGTQVTGVYLNKATTSILVGKSETLTAAILPTSATNQGVTWASSNTGIATVTQEGLVTGIAAGTASITVTAADTANGTQTASCEVTVTAETVSVTGITLTKASTSILVDGAELLSATISPTNATNQTVTWTSSDTAIVTVSQVGLVTGIAAGTATITVTTEDGSKTASCGVTVTMAAVSVSGVSLTETTANILIGEEKTLTAAIEPSNATNQNILWESSHTNIAAVTQGGLVTGKAAGTAAITVTTADGSKTATCEVTVSPIAVTGVALNKTSTSILVGSTEPLTAKISPDDSTDQGITWKSSNTSIATVSDQGLITGIAVGSATITATAADTSNGTQTATCEVMVNPITVTGITLNTGSIALFVGSSNTLTAAIVPPNATNQTVTWESSAPAIATISDSGTVTAVAVGTATITATAGDTTNGTKTAVCEVIVSPGVTLTYTGPNFTSWKVLYAAWIEDENGNNLQNLYVCTRVKAQNVTGTALPYWEKNKRTQLSSDIDAVTGASAQGSNTITRILSLGSVRKIRVCFEIDRSTNGNDYFMDRPSFTYKTDLIDLDNLVTPYNLNLDGWMSNGTTVSEEPSFGQDTTTVPDWEAYKYMYNLLYVAKGGTTNDWTDMVTSLTATVTAQ